MPTLTGTWMTHKGGLGATEGGRPRVGLVKVKHSNIGTAVGERFDLVDGPNAHSDGRSNIKELDGRVRRTIKTNMSCGALFCGRRTTLGCKEVVYGHVRWCGCGYVS